MYGIVPKNIQDRELNINESNLICANNVVQDCNRSQSFIQDGERFNSDDQVFDFFKRKQVWGLKLLQEPLLELNIVKVLQDFLLRVESGVFVQNKLEEQILIDPQNTDNVVLERITMNKDLRDEVVMRHVDVLDLLGGNVFTLRQLEEVLHTVNDLDLVLRVQLHDITGGEPALRVDGVLCGLFVLEIFVEDLWTSQ
ncbi:hypothetical protein WICPIJ_001845 [Wickerhamomyces pijperi]|uniref:Uncharacterized protein n=1 Tax=Wickerhamomyces pijperi TaxID=599730 RepID=A0A9P8TQS0_WICPI|nr:hypothetical protein WICPIJ_001845 [Wickerhamomyces pijperi]